MLGGELEVDESWVSRQFRNCRTVCSLIRGRTSQGVRSCLLNLPQYSSSSPQPTWQRYSSTVIRPLFKVFSDTPSPLLSLTSMPQNPPRLSPHPRLSRSFPCTLSGCKGRFSRRRDVRRHENTVHGAEKKHCGYNGCKFRGTVRLDVLRKHLRNHHSSSSLTGELLRQMSAKLASAESTD